MSGQIRTKEERLTEGESSNRRHDEELMVRLDEVFRLGTSSEHQSHELAKISSEYSAIDLSYAALRLPLSYRIQIFDEIDDDLERAHFFTHIDSTTRELLFAEMEDEEIARMIEEMPSDEAVFVIEDLVLPRLGAVLNRLSEAKAQSIEALSRHRPNTAGRLMTNEYFAFQMDTNIGQAARYIRDHPRIDLMRRVFVLDENQELQGFVPLRTLVINPPSLPLKKVMRQIAHIVSVDAPRDEVIELFERYKMTELPVIDHEGQLCGIITYEDVAEAIEDQTDETLAQISGTAQEVRIDDPLLKNFFARAPWLFVTLVAGIINANNMEMFQIHHVFVLFVPLVIGMSGNIGIQCSTLMIRAMATGYMTRKNVRKAVLMELRTAVFTGVLFGIFCGLVLFLIGSVGIFESPLPIEKLSLIIATGQIGACLFGAAIGSWSPIFFNRLGFDAAISSGPITTAFNDVLANLVYFLIATHLLAFFSI